MRKTLLAILLLFLFKVNYAQINYGLKAGANLASMADEFTDYKVGIGYFGGAFAEFRVSKKLFIRPEFLYSEESFKQQFGNNGSLNTTISYLNVPLLIGIRPVDKLKILGGFKWGYNLNTTFRAEGAKNSVKDFYKNDNSLSLGLDYELRNKVGITLHYNHGINKLQTIQLADEAGDSLGNKKFSLSRTFQLGVSYSFTNN